MKNKRARIIAWTLALLPLAIAAAVYTRLPEQIPTHWNIGGSVTYSGKGQIWMISSLSAGMLLLFEFLPKIDPRKESYEKFRKYYDGFCIMMMAFLLIIDLIILSESFFPGNISVGKVVSALMGVLFIFMGNLMPKLKSNFFMGVRTPWTLSDKDVWNKTHRLAGNLFFLSGLVMLLVSFWLPELIVFCTMMGLLAITVLWTTLRSYLWYRENKAKKAVEGGPGSRQPADDIPE